MTPEMLEQVKAKTAEYCEMLGVASPASPGERGRDEDDLIEKAFYDATEGKRQRQRLRETPAGYVEIIQRLTADLAVRDMTIAALRETLDRISKLHAGNLAAEDAANEAVSIACKALTPPAGTEPR